MFYFLIIAAIATQLFICYRLVVHLKNIEKEILLQDKINSLAAKRLDIASEQLDAIYELIKLESKRLDAYKNDKNDDSDWWKNF
jgi:hypothetical protein